MNITFFLGSGISLESDLPCTKCLTEFLFCKNFSETSAERYVGSNSDSEKVSEIKCFLKKLKYQYEEYVSYFTKKNYEMNYEDLYYVLEQLKSVDESYLKDYSILYFKETFRKEVKKNYGEYLRLIKDSSNFIFDVVRSSLYHRKISGLNLFNEIKFDSDFKQVSIGTLNHDLLIENFLRDEIVDGFRQNGELRYFEPSEYERIDKKFYLYKLHGSINWFYWSKTNSDGTRYPIKLGLKEGGNLGLYDELLDSDRNKWKIEEDRPILLIGQNKTFRYYYQDYFELHYQFFKRLKDLTLLIMSGYGGSDNLINFRIKDWLESSKENKILFLYEDEQPPHYFLGYKSQYNIIPKWFSKTTLEDIKKSKYLP